MHENVIFGLKYEDIVPDLPILHFDQNPLRKKVNIPYSHIFSDLNNCFY